MKKFFILMAVLFGSLTSIHAQQSYVATLQHEDSFTYYYGQTALTNAYNAAVDGDIITLSAGSFNFSGSFGKGITLRGMGIEATNKTYIIGEINFFSTDPSWVTNIEGIIFNNKCNTINSTWNGNIGQGRMNFIKNIFNAGIDAYDSPNNKYDTEKGPTFRFYNDIIYTKMWFKTEKGISKPYNYQFSNCYIMNPYGGDYNTNSSTLIHDYMPNFVNYIIVFNAIVYASGSYGSLYYYAPKNCFYFNFMNCIFNYYFPNVSSGLYDLPSTSTCTNCLSINRSTLFRELPTGQNINNKTASSCSDVFKTYNGGYTAGETFELTDEAKATYIGIDGTEIGMQGGVMPYTPTVGYPVITKLDAAAKTTKDGQLTIEIEVDGK